MDLKSDKGAELTLPEVATTHRRPRPARSHKFLTRIGIALSLLFLYKSSHSQYPFQVAQKIKAWKHPCSGVNNNAFDNYISRVEDAFLSAPPTFRISTTDVYVT